MAIKYELMVPSSQYQKDGETKTRWLKVGAVFMGERGPSIKLDCVPTSVVDRDGNTVAWDGWLKCLEPRQREQRPQPQAPQQAAPTQTGGFDDDIPF